MKLSTWSRRELSQRLEGPGLDLQTGPFISRIHSHLATVIDGISLLYAENQSFENASFADFHVALTRPSGPRRWIRPQVNFELDGVSLFKPLPLDQALPMLEWGLNWCIGNYAHQYLIIHAAAIERNGFCVILPGPPGSGKSTLAAFLVHNGWRLLSDEMALLSLEDLAVTALARPVSLKNRSIDIIEQLVPDATLSCRVEDTIKGTVALMRAPRDSVARVAEKALPAWIIFPRYKEGAKATLKPHSKADTLIEIGRNAFNYSIHGSQGFAALSRLMDQCACYSLSYSNLNEAQELLAALAPHNPLESCVSK